jgi:hypothetical protein
MDDAQVTGATSSYARKYALNGLFLLDDTKDVDTEEYQAASYTESSKNTTKKATAEKPTEAKENHSPARQKLSDFLAKNNFTKEDKAKIIAACKLTPTSADDIYETALKFAEDMLEQKKREKRPDDYGDVPFEV